MNSLDDDDISVVENTAEREITRTFLFSIVYKSYKSSYNISSKYIYVCA